ncbi:golgin subfamily A member 6-like protein 22 [Eriocheir sinensis]|uniref:golgin subfamily A member 6-like protein 22 n=1 Tax=Eriocheir sinensis TaxID=95602 RepID=UPI0021C76BC7|nr:golgin subfamily A member 6-like protein 22 [Eriocheir sinensis]
MAHRMTRTLEVNGRSPRHGGGGGGGEERGGGEGGGGGGTHTFSIPSSSSSPLISRAIVPTSLPSSPSLSSMSPPSLPSPSSPPASFSPILRPASSSSFLMTQTTQGLTSSFNQSYTTLVRLEVQPTSFESTEGGEEGGLGGDRGLETGVGAAGGGVRVPDNPSDSDKMTPAIENGGPGLTTQGGTSEIFVEAFHTMTRTSYSNWGDVELFIREEDDPLPPQTPHQRSLPQIPQSSAPQKPPSQPPAPHRRARWDKGVAEEHRKNGLVLAQMEEGEQSETEWKDGWSETRSGAARVRWNETCQTHEWRETGAETGGHLREWNEMDDDLDEWNDETGNNDTDLGETDIGDTTDHNETDLGETDYNETDLGDTDLGETTDHNETDLGETDYNDPDQTEESKGDETRASNEAGDENKSETTTTKTADQSDASHQDPTQRHTAGKRQGDKTRPPRPTHGEIELERPTKQKVKRSASARSRRGKHSDMEKEETVEKKSTEGNRAKTEAEVMLHVREKERAVRELSVMRSRLANLRKIIHGKNEEIRTLKARLKEERQTEVTASREKLVRPGTQTSSAELAHLRRQVASLRQEKERLREEVSSKVSAERERKVELLKARQEQERRVRQAKREAVREGVKENREIATLQRTIEMKEKELRARQQVVHKLECEKMYLGEEILRITGVEEGFWSDQTLVSNP